MLFLDNVDLIFLSQFCGKLRNIMKNNELCL